MLLLRKNKDTLPVKDSLTSQWGDIDKLKIHLNQLLMFYNCCSINAPSYFLEDLSNLISPHAFKRTNMTANSQTHLHDISSGGSPDHRTPWDNVHAGHLLCDQEIQSHRWDNPHCKSQPRWTRGVLWHQVQYCKWRYGN